MRLVEQAFTQLLTTADIRAAVGAMPSGAGWQGAPGTSSFLVYAVVFPLTGPTDGPSSKADRDIFRRFQVTAIGPSTDSASFLGDRVLGAVSGKRITTTTRTTMQPVSIEEVGALDRDDTVQPSLWMVRHIFGVATTPLS